MKIQYNAHTGMTEVLKANQIVYECYGILNAQNFIEENESK